MKQVRGHWIKWIIVDKAHIVEPNINLFTLFFPSKPIRHFYLFAFIAKFPVYAMFVCTETRSVSITLHLTKELMNLINRSYLLIQVPRSFGKWSPKCGNYAIDRHHCLQGTNLKAFTFDLESFRCSVILSWTPSFKRSINNQTLLEAKVK